MENRAVMKRVFPTIFAAAGVRRVERVAVDQLSDPDLVKVGEQREGLAVTIRRLTGERLEEADVAVELRAAGDDFRRGHREAGRGQGRAHG